MSIERHSPAGRARESSPLLSLGALAADIDAHVPLPSGSEAEVALRAAAMVGVGEVVRHVNASRGEQLTPTELGNFLWGVLGKTPAYRTFNRHATKDTVFY